MKLKERLKALIALRMIQILVVCVGVFGIFCVVQLVFLFMAADSIDGDSKLTPDQPKIVQENN